MGWNDVAALNDNPLFKGFEEEARFYFLHSFFFECEQEQHRAATSSYGLEFSCAVQAGNVYGVQFHPEKSHHFGVGLLKTSRNCERKLTNAKTGSFHACSSKTVGW